MSSMARLPMPGIARSSSSVMEDNLLTRLMPPERSALTTQAGILLRASISLEAARGFDDVRAGREAILIPQMNCDRQNRQEARAVPAIHR